MPKPFQDGDLVLFVDARARQYLKVLGVGKVFQSHVGVLPHDEVIGRDPGVHLETNTGKLLLAVRPTLAEYVMKMRRASQIIYPKDTGAILVYGDIFPGATVLEAGVGSGAMTLALLRAVGPTGRVITYEQRQDMAANGARNIRGFMGEPENFTLRMGDIYEPTEERDVDRVMLDVPEPWQALEPLSAALITGGILIAYLPTVLQVHRLHQALEDHPCYTMAETFEVMLRPWHLAETSARPAHRMVAHTGFITRAVRCQPPPRRLKKKAVEEDPLDETAQEQETEP